MRIVIHVVGRVCPFIHAVHTWSACFGDYSSDILSDLETDSTTPISNLVIEACLVFEELSIPDGSARTEASDASESVLVGPVESDNELG